MPKNPLDLTEAEVRASAAERRTRSPAEPKDDHRDDAPPERSGPYSHGDYGVLESDNQDKPYIHRQNSPEMDSIEAMEAAERRR